VHVGVATALLKHAAPNQSNRRSATRNEVVTTPSTKEHTMNITLRTLIAAAGIAVTFGASAQTATPNIDQRQANQQARIEQGKATGTLSKREAARMEAGQAKVQGMKQAAAADGKVTRAERKAIQKEQNKQSRRIHRQKHDGNKK